MWPIKLNFKNCFKKIKACATAGVSVHISSFLGDSSVMVLINIDSIFEFIICSAPRLVVFAKDKTLTNCNLPLHNTARSQPPYHIGIYLGPKEKKSWMQTAPQTSLIWIARISQLQTWWSNTLGVYGEYSGIKLGVFLSNGYVRMMPTQQNALLCGREKKRKTLLQFHIDPACFLSRTWPHSACSWPQRFISWAFKITCYFNNLKSKLLKKQLCDNYVRLWQHLEMVLITFSRYWKNFHFFKWLENLGHLCY